MVSVAFSTGPLRGMDLRLIREVNTVTKLEKRVSTLETSTKATGVPLASTIGLGQFIFGTAVNAKTTLYTVPPTQVVSQQVFCDGAQRVERPEK
jgi:hypothetical protein